MTAALTLTLTLALRENRRLRDQLVTMAAARARAGGLEEGQVLAPIRLNSSLNSVTGTTVAVHFEGAGSGTLLLFHASSCDACEVTRPLWRRAIEEAARPDVRVFCVQTDGAEGALSALEGLPASLGVPLPPIGWLAALPAVPATLLVDDSGVLTRAWYGELDERTAQELSDAIAAIEH